MLDVMHPVTYARLIENGWTRRTIRAAVTLGSVRRLARGWYEVGTSAAHESAAAVAGVRVGCLTGLRDHGVWVPPTAHPHVLVPRWTAPPVAGVRHDLPRRGAWVHGSIMYDVVECLRQALRYHDVETSLIVLESACHLGLVDSREVRELISLAPRRSAPGLSRFDPRSESGTETRVRLFLARLGYGVRPQVLVRGIGRVDLLVGESLIIECDSRAHHTGEETYQRDRARDLVAAALGYRVIRLTWEQVFLDWEATQMLLLVHLRTRHYRRPPAGRVL